MCFSTCNLNYIISQHFFLLTVYGRVCASACIMAVVNGQHENVHMKATFKSELSREEITT